MELHLLFLALSLHQGATVAVSPNAAETIICAGNSRQIVSNNSNKNLWPWQTFQSSSAQPPLLLIESTGEPLSEGLLVFDAFDGSTMKTTQEASPLIMTDGGDLVWNGPIDATENVRVQTFNGAPVLTYFSGQGTAGAESVVGHGYGEVVVLNSSYDRIATVCPQFSSFTMETGVTASCHADLHESLITDRNTMLVTAYNTTQADMTSVGGPKDGWVIDSIVVEVNITTGEILFQWSPLAHVPINGTHYPVGSLGQNQSVPFDFFHTNAIQLVGENYLINSRHFFSTYLVSPEGDILWEINGITGGDFGPLPTGASFSWQHFARILSSNSSQAVISWFANNNALPGQPGAKLTTGLTLQLSLPPNKATSPVLLTNLTDSSLRVSSWSQGSFLPLPNGNLFMGYGSEPLMVEYGPADQGKTSATPRWSAMFGYGDLVSSYRAYKQVWHATPSEQPSLVVQPIAANTILHCQANATFVGYVSWNGATDVTGWIVYAGATNTSLTAVGMAQNEGFETEFAVPAGAAFLQVGAVENNGTVPVRMSNVVAVAK